MDRQLDDDGYDVTDEDGGRASSRLPVVVVGVASAVVLTVSAGLVAFTMSGSDTTEHTARAAEATVVTALGNTVSGGAAAIDAAVPYTTAALDGSMAEPLGLAAGGDTVPPRVLEAYRAAESTLAEESPTCRLPWWLLAGVGKVQSDHAAGGQVDANGTASVRIVGPRLDGTVVGGSMVRDTDDGRLDGDTTFDRGVGPMLLLPQTWEHIGRDGGADGPADVANADDAALAVGTLLCSADADLTTPDGLARGLVMFDDSARFPADVLPWAAYYRAQLGDSGTASPTTSATTTDTDSAPDGDASTPAPATDADADRSPAATGEGQDQTEEPAPVGPGFTTQPTTEPPSADPPAVAPRPASTPASSQSTPSTRNTPNAPAETPRRTTGSTSAAPATPAPERTTASSTTPPRTPSPSRSTSSAPRPTTDAPRPTSTPQATSTPRQTTSTTSTATSASTPTEDRPRSTPTRERQRSSPTPTSTPTATRERRRSTPSPAATPTATRSERQDDRQRERQSERRERQRSDDGDDERRERGQDRNGRDDSDDDD